uniref:Uncharacterized protein n=1 Tax=Chaetoceros debilis TaxID=122233 RepID=A0A7S3V9E9_9STRA
MELVLGIAHTYIIRCRRKRRNNDGVSEIIGGGGVGNHHHHRNRNRNGLIRIMAKMVFDRRISRIHRRHLGIVLHRLLKMTERGIGSNKINGKGTVKKKSSVRERKYTVEAAVALAYLDFLERLLIQSTVTHHNHIKENQQGETESGIGNESTTGKRKRSGADSGDSDDNRLNGKSYPTVEGLCEILPLIRTISTSPILWSKMSTSTNEALMTMMSNLLSFQCASSRGNDNGNIISNVDACKSGRMDKNSTKRRSKSRGGSRRNALSSQLAKMQLLLRDNPDLLQVSITFLSAASATGASASTGASGTSDSNSTKSQSSTYREQHQQLLEIMALALSQVHTQKVAGAFRDHNLALYRLAKDLVSSTSTTAEGGPPEQVQILTPKILEYVTTTLKALTSSRKSQMSQKCGCTILLSGMATIIATSAATPNHASSQGIKSAITSSFNLLLSNRNASIVAMTMSSLEEFAKKVSDRRMIPGCVPPKSQSLLQARLKNEIYCTSSRRSIMVTPERIFYWRSKEGEKLVMSSKTNRHFFPGLLLPSTKSPISFEVGARILQINDPNDKTKRVFVIIPPQNHDVVNLTDISKWEVGKEGSVMRVDSLRGGRRCNISTG